MSTQSYPQTAVNKLGRLAKRGTYDQATVHHLVDTSPVVHVSFNDPAHPFPVVLPMIGCTGAWDAAASAPGGDDDEHVVYLHGYVSGRLFKKSGEATGDESEEGLPITIAATHLDGLVLSLTPFHNSLNYRSAVLYGHATLIPSTSPEALHAMQLLTDNLLPTRWENSRVPPTSAELSSTSILRVRIASASAKIRAGGPSEDRKDLADAELKAKCWTGVVPYWGTWGEPVPGKENGREEVEGYIEAWRVKETGGARGRAFEAAEK